MQKKEEELLKNASMSMDEKKTLTEYYAGKFVNEEEIPFVSLTDVGKILKECSMKVSDKDLTAIKSALATDFANENPDLDNLLV
jgi:hypothetical protein